MSRVSRRKFLSGAAVVIGATPILLTTACQQAAPAAPTPAPAAPTPAPGTTPAPAPAPTQPPAAKLGGSLAIVQGSYFNKVWQDFAKEKFEDWGKQEGVNVAADFLAWPDLQPKIGAAIQAGGIDVCEMWPGWNHLYQASLVDVTDIAQAVADAGGGFEQYVLNSGPVGNQWFGVPHGESGGLIAYRMSWFQEAIDALGWGNRFQAADSSTMDLTWDEWFEIGAWLKTNKDKPLGQAFGHSTGDPPGVAYPYMWSNGSMEREADEKTIALNTPEFVDAVERFIPAWKAAFDEAGLSWDDASNNRAYNGGEISSTFNGSSIYFAARQNLPDLAEDTNHMLMPKGAVSGERYNRMGTRTMAILKNSRNVDAAKAFLQWFFSDDFFPDWFRIHEGYMVGNTKKWAEDPVWEKDEKLTIYREVPKYGRADGYAGPPDAKAAEVYSKYIIVDLYARAFTSGDAKGAIAWAEDQLKRVYG